MIILFNDPIRIFWTILVIKMIILVFMSTTTTAKPSGKESTAPPPPFFLQDPKDGMCLAGETFRRCSIDTLFYVTGSPGSYQIHKRSATTSTTATEEEDGDVCIARKSCADATNIDKIESLKLAKCSHCGAKEWNILGDADTGYVLTAGGGGSRKDDDDDKKKKRPTCVFRHEQQAQTAPCDSEDVKYTPLQLRFAGEADLIAMSSPGARLVGAAADGDIYTIKAMLDEKKMDANAKDWDGLTAIIPAASAGNWELVQLLVEQYGADVNAADKDGITALMEASIMGHAPVVKYLLEKGATVDAAAGSDVTAVWLAASEGQVECMRVLLERGADAKNARSDGITALMTACVGGKVDAVKILLEYGADVTATDKDGLTPLMNAAENGTVALLELLTNAIGPKDDAAEDHVDVVSKEEYVNALSHTGYNALILAAAHGNVDAVRHLLANGANVDAVSPDMNVTALMYAAASDKVDVLEALIKQGKANLEFKHSNGGTALMEACTGKAVNAIRVLLEKGAVVDYADDDGVTPLMAIASVGNMEGQQLVVDALQKKFGNNPQLLADHINLMSRSGGTTVMFAAAGGHLESTRQLVELGADWKATAHAAPGYLEKLAKMVAEGTVPDEGPHVDGVTALHVAAQGGHLAVVDYLIQVGADVSVKDDEERTPLVLAIKGNHGKVANSLVKAGANPNTPFVDEKGETHNLLFDAVMVENEEFAKLLIENGADLYHKDEKNVSTLLQASHRGLADIVKLLLEKHAASGKSGYVDDASDEGITPLIAACSEGHLEVAKLIIEAKANVNAKDQDQTNALMAAAARGHAEIVKELVAAGASVNEQNADGHTALMFAYNGKNQVETLWERYKQYLREADTDRTKDLDDNGTGPIIQGALDNHIALIELLYKHGADATLKDKEGHTAKDFDYHPDQDAEILEKESKAEKVRDQSKNEL
jgi:ankyrin repeat protein